MVKKKGVTLVVDEKFFMRLDKQRQKKQRSLEMEFGRPFNLSQRKFTGMLAANNVMFGFPKTKSIKRRKKNR